METYKEKLDVPNIQVCVINEYYTKNGIDTSIFTHYEILLRIQKSYNNIIINITRLTMDHNGYAYKCNRNISNGDCKNRRFFDDINFDSENYKYYLTSILIHGFLMYLNYESKISIQQENYFNIVFKNNFGFSDYKCCSITKMLFDFINKIFFSYLDFAIYTNVYIKTLVRDEDLLRKLKETLLKYIKDEDDYIKNNRRHWSNTIWKDDK